jgi:hypothetical protein
MPTAIQGRFSSERLLHVVLWCAQALLGATFAALALLKLLSHRDRLIEIMPWTASIPQWFVYTLGALELIGAFLVSVPAVTRTPQRIVAWSAVGFCTLMTSATWIHAWRGEWRLIPLTFAVAVLAAFVAWGRMTHAPLEEQGDLR